MSAGVNSVMALSAASRADWPLARCTVMFSTITMASSMTMPMQAANPPSVMRLKLMLNSYMNTMAMRQANGITTAATSVVRHDFRNTSSTPIDSARPIRIASTTPWIESRTRMDWS